MAKGAWQEQGRKILDPVVGLLAATGVSPTAVTLAGVAVTIASAVVIGRGEPRLGGIILIFASLCDALDGALARRTGRVSRFGAFLDSTLDRIAETATLAGIAAFFQRSDYALRDLLVLATFAALAGSLLTSYARARAEGLDLECKVGLLERPERVVLTVLGLLIGPRALAASVLVILVLSWFTVLQRIEHVRRVIARAEAAGVGSPGRPRS